MNQSKFFSSLIVDSEKQLDRVMDSIDFFDIFGIDESSCLVLRDSLVVNSKCIQSCSAFVYSASKLILWRTYLHLSSAFAGYDRRRTRLALTDTDSGEQGHILTDRRTDGRTKRIIGLRAHN